MSATKESGKFSENSKQELSVRIWLSGIFIPLTTPVFYDHFQLWHMTSWSFLRAGIMSSYVSIQGPWKFMVTSQLLMHLDCWVKANNFWGQWGKTTRLSCCMLKSSSRSKWILGIWAAACVCCPRQKCTWREMLDNDSCNHPCLKGCYCPQKYRQQHPTGNNKKKRKRGTTAHPG